jgi:hypothetical protein
MKIVGLLETALIEQGGTRKYILLISFFLFYTDLTCASAVNNTSFVLNEIKILQRYTSQVCSLIYGFTAKVVANGAIKSEMIETESAIRM